MKHDITPFKKWYTPPLSVSTFAVWNLDVDATVGVMCTSDNRPDIAQHCDVNDMIHI